MNPWIEFPAISDGGLVISENVPDVFSHTPVSYSVIESLSVSEVSVNEISHETSTDVRTTKRKIFNLTITPPE
jgi:hypothetical protein